ncbi:MAG: NrfD/PsrC family molybdoenzyme membrane anchor subunit [Acidobacteriota bacterium]
MTGRLAAVKTALWTIMGVLAVVSVARFSRGLGAVTSLSDATPWGLWIAFDVMAGVALAAGGFTLAAAVYIFGLTRYRVFVRPAVLTAFLGYIAVAVGLVYDLGLPWHIWHPIVYPQAHSVLFEVAMCVMLYLTVLALEFSPVVLEHPLFDRPVFRAIHHALTRVTIPLVILGIMLSTLHQSSLGSLFLITPFRVHPLWYSPIIWILFLVSAIGVGLATITLESHVAAWLFNHERPDARLAGLGRAASVVLLLYAALRIGDLAVRGRLHLAFEASPVAGLFWLELASTALVPGVLLAVPAVRRHARALGFLALSVVIGVVGYRFNVAIVAFWRPDELPYFPTWVELAVSAGVVAGAALVFIFFVEHLRVYPEDTGAAHDTPARLRVDPYATTPLLPVSLAAPRRYSMGFVAGAAVAVAALPAGAMTGRLAAPVPAAAALVVPGVVSARNPLPGHELRVDPAATSGARLTARIGLMVIDANRDGRIVLFPHDLHENALGGDNSCTACHHASLPFTRVSSCAGCHRDMYSPSDMFDHAYHVASLGGNAGCTKCHVDAGAAKTRASATGCDRCHAQMLLASVRVARPTAFEGKASAYLEAMHSLCISCHAERERLDPNRYPATFAECRNCHRDDNGTPIRTLEPYAGDRHVAAGAGLWE